MNDEIRIGIAGNPNCGKTTLFNGLTGTQQRVGNWPGVTVERKVGQYSFNKQAVEVVDLPGIYSLSTSSLDEQVARDYILNEHPDLIVNIVDASNLERNLYLTIQLMEMKVPMILVLNMMDMLKRKQMKLKVAQLAKILDIPVVATVANKNEGIEELKELIQKAAMEKHISAASIYFPKEVEDVIAELRTHLESRQVDEKYDYRWLSIKLLEQDISIERLRSDRTISELVDTKNTEIETILGEDTDVIIADSRYGFINTACKKVLDKSNVIRKHVSDNIDRVVLNRALGIPIFLAAMYFTFWMTINLGGCFIDFFDGFFGAVFVDGFGALLESINVPAFIKTLLADGIGGGIQTVSTFIPPIFFIFFCLAILEDSGYMARAAFVMDRMMRAIGLPGKAFVPMLVGFGCNVPAIMATRTLDNEKDRVLTIMMNPFMSCGARMPVYALFAAAFFPKSGSMVVFSLYLIGIVLAIMTAYILKSTILKGEASSFIMELPPYHIPTLKGILLHTWERLKAFMLRAGKAILLVVIILSFFNSLGTDGSFGNADSQKSILSKVGKTIVPVFKPMGMTDENWPAAVGIFTGIFAKEAVIGTLDALYTIEDTNPLEGERDAFDFFGDITDAFATIPENLSKLSLPFSIAGLLGTEVDSAIEDLDVKDDTYISMRNRFDGKVGAFAYLLMILLYMPCVAAVAAVYKELNLSWTIFSCLYLSALAWMTSTFFYQVMRFFHHPGTSLFWVGLVLTVFVVFVFVLKKKGSLYKNEE